MKDKNEKIYHRDTESTEIHRDNILSLAQSAKLKSSPL
jgi:hypothetical protein